MSRAAMKKRRRSLFPDEEPELILAWILNPK
jgi:hypothetical protein